MYCLNFHRKIWYDFCFKKWNDKRIITSMMMNSMIHFKRVSYGKHWNSLLKFVKLIKYVWRIPIQKKCTSKLWLFLLFWYLIRWQIFHQIAYKCFSIYFLYTRDTYSKKFSYLSSLIPLQFSIQLSRYVRRKLSSNFFIQLWEKGNQSI